MKLKFITILSILLLVTSVSIFAQKITITVTKSDNTVMGTSVIQFDSDASLLGLDGARQKGTELFPDTIRHRVAPGQPPAPIAIPANLAEWLKVSIIGKLQAVVTAVAPNAQVQAVTTQIKNIQTLQKNLKAAQALQVK